MVINTVLDPGISQSQDDPRVYRELTQQMPLGQTEEQRDPSFPALAVRLPRKRRQDGASEHTSLP